MIGRKSGAHTIEWKNKS
jgi:hypothetical protein